MMKIYVAAVASLLAAAGLGLAQQTEIRWVTAHDEDFTGATPKSEPEPLPAPMPVKPDTRNKMPGDSFSWEASCGDEMCCDTGSACGPTFWGDAQYLLWWSKRGPNPNPLVTTSSRPTIPGAGGIGVPGTTVLFGAHTLDYPAQSGGRLTFGAWLDCNNTVGVEWSGFLLERAVVHFQAASGPDGNPFLAFPITLPDGAAVGVTVAAPGAVRLPPRVGAIIIGSTSQLWGTEANVVFNLTQNCSSSADLLVGFRYADLLEKLEIDGFSVATATGTTTAGSDIFQTRNQFYGGQIGARFLYRMSAFSLESAVKVAMGPSHETVNIEGNIATTTAAGVRTAFPGSLYAEPSNIGHTTQDRFTVIPEVQLNLGYNITQHVRAFVGYNFLYWNDIARPGDQINPVINTTQRLGGPLIGPAEPTPVFNHTDFWVQGVNFGLAIGF